MESCKYELENITELCSFGAKYPEIRITEIKSLMRFWWRALSEFNSYEEMLKNEEKIFGSSNGKLNLNSFKSPIVFKVNKVTTNRSKYDKHINIGSLGCFKSNKVELDIKLTVQKRKICNNEYSDKSIEFYDSLLRLSLILGGVGRRSRKGCGVFWIKEDLDIDIDKLKDTIKIYLEKLSLGECYSISEEKGQKFMQISRNNKLTLGYPYVEEILISKNSIEEITFYNKIKEAMKMCKKNKYTYGKGKLACPVYVTCYKWEDKLYPIIIKLHNTHPSYSFENYYDEFKEEIL